MTDLVRSKGSWGGGHPSWTVSGAAGAVSWGCAPGESALWPRPIGVHRSASTCGSLPHPGCPHLGDCRLTRRYEDGDRLRRMVNAGAGDEAIWHELELLHKEHVGGAA